jgi:hypothetical protein
MVHPCRVVSGSNYPVMIPDIGIKTFFWVFLLNFSGLETFLGKKGFKLGLALGFE